MAREAAVAKCKHKSQSSASKRPRDCGANLSCTHVGRPGSGGNGAAAAKSGANAEAPAKRKLVPIVAGSTAERGTSRRPDVFKRPRQEQRQQRRISLTESVVPLKDSIVARALSELVPRKPSTVRGLMRNWEKPIIKASIPGELASRRWPSKAMLMSAKTKVLAFYEKEAALGLQSDIAKAFYLASGEQKLRFDWPAAMGRVQRARLDRRYKIDRWDECLAMCSGDTNAQTEIYVCGTKVISLDALTSLICHEGLHNMARRVRPGNSYLSESIEHIAMALIGDPQLVNVEML